MNGKRKTGVSPASGKWILVGLGVIFVGSIIWSFIYETLMPLVAQGDAGAVVRNLIGFPIILAGTAIFAYGGFVFVRDTFGVMANPQMVENLAQIKDSEAPGDAVKRARRQNLWLLVRAWKDGSARMALGFALIAVGGWLINL